MLKATRDFITKLATNITPYKHKATGTSVSNATRMGLFARHWTHFPDVSSYGKLLVIGLVTGSTRQQANADACSVEDGLELDVF